MIAVQVRLPGQGKYIRSRSGQGKINSYEGQSGQGQSGQGQVREKWMMQSDSLTLKTYFYTSKSSSYAFLGNSGKHNIPVIDFIQTAKDFFAPKGWL